MTISRWIFLEWEMFKINAECKIKTHILCSIIFPPLKSCRLRDNVEKCGWAREAADDNMATLVFCISKGTRARAHARALALTTFPPTHRHKRTHPRAEARTHTHTQIRNTYCFSTASIILRTPLSVRLYVHCLSCYMRDKCVYCAVRTECLNTNEVFLRVERS